MAFENMAARLVGWFPKLDKNEAYNMVNDAWLEIRNDRLWSFQLFEDGIATPNTISTGSYTGTLGSNQVTLNAAASAAVTGIANPVLTQRQFRPNGLSIYSIIAANFTVPAAVVLTLDRNYIDTPGSGLSYIIFQSLYPAPYQDFKRWLDWRDMVNGEWLDVHSTKREVDMGDPQRLYFTFPHWVIGTGEDIRGIGTSTPSATLGFPLFELYPNPTQIIQYMRWGIRTGADLVNPSDTLPYPMTEKLVNAKSRMLGAQWAEANRDPNVPRGQSADYKFIYQAAEAQYDRELKLVGFKDRDIVDLFLTKIIRDHDVRKEPYYSSLTGRAYGQP